MITIDDKELKELERDFKTYAKRAYPFATKATINTAAFQTQKAAKGRIKEKLINRNRFTEQSIRVEQARTLAVSRQEAIVGSIADYMETQEFGGSKKRTGRHGVAIPTNYAAGDASGGPRLRLPKKSRKLRNIKLKKLMRRTAGGKEQAWVFKMQEAVESGSRYFFHRWSRTSGGIYRVIGGRKGFKRGVPKGAKAKLVYSISKPVVQIPATPWLGPSVEEVQKRIPKIYRDAMVFQARRHRLFGYK